MAVDSQEKRINAQKVGRPWKRTHLAETQDEQWRMSVGNTYGGNALSAGTFPFWTIETTKILDQ